MNYYVYILYSVTHDRYYIGQTNHINNRITRHNNGYVKYTKSFRPWKLVHLETYPDRVSAMSRESQLKSWKFKLKIAELING